MSIFDQFGPFDSDPTKEFQRAMDHVKLKGAEEQRAMLIRKAQNQNDRSWNRALREVVHALNLSPGQVAEIKALRKEVRHVGEFGDT